MSPSFYMSITFMVEKLGMREPFLLVPTNYYSTWMDLLFVMEPIFFSTRGDAPFPFQQNGNSRVHTRQRYRKLDQRRGERGTEPPFSAWFRLKRTVAKFKPGETGTQRTPHLTPRNRRSKNPRKWTERRRSFLQSASSRKPFQRDSLLRIILLCILSGWEQHPCVECCRRLACHYLVSTSEQHLHPFKNLALRLMTV